MRTKVQVQTAAQQLYFCQIISVLTIISSHISSGPFQSMYWQKNRRSAVCMSLVQAARNRFTTPVPYVLTTSRCPGLINPDQTSSVHRSVYGLAPDDGSVTLGLVASMFGLWRTGLGTIVWFSVCCLEARSCRDMWQPTSIMEWKYTARELNDYLSYVAIQRLITLHHERWSPHQHKSRL